MDPTRFDHRTRLLSGAGAVRRALVEAVLTGTAAEAHPIEHRPPPAERDIGVGLTGHLDELLVADPVRCARRIARSATRRGRMPPMKRYRMGRRIDVKKCARIDVMPKRIMAKLI